jgi:threonine dehydrogenase-like Zn-dependent dehydrogenase
VALERALLAVLSVLAMRHIREAQLQIGDPVLVLGSDPWSLLLLQWARLQGASPLVLARRGSLVLGEQASFFALDAELPDPTPSDLARVVKLTHREAGFAMAIDALGTEQSIALALPALRDGGRYVLAGLTPQPLVSLNAYPDLHRRDLELVSPTQSLPSSEFARWFRFNLALAEQRRLRIDGLLNSSLGWRAIVT